MITAAALRVRCRSPGVASSLGDVLAPDNEGAPRSLRIKESVGGSSLAFEVESESASSTISTCLGLLRDIALFEQVWLLTEPPRPRVSGGKKS